MVLMVDTLEAAKDFLYVRDVVRAFELLIEKGAHGSVYNVCSGYAVKIRTIRDTLLSISGERIELVQDMDKKRPTDTVALYGDRARLTALGWEPAFSLEDGLRELLVYWRKRGAPGRRGGHICIH